MLVQGPPAFLKIDPKQVFGLAQKYTLSNNFKTILISLHLLNGWQLAKMKKSIPDMSLP